jgi:hypothetical protein
MLGVFNVDRARALETYANLAARTRTSPAPATAHRWSARPVSGCGSLGGRRA